MYRTGMFDESSESMERELLSLKKKLPLGSNIRQFVLNRDYEVTSYRQFVTLVQKFQHNLPRKKTRSENVRLGGELDPYEGASFDDVDEVRTQISDLDPDDVEEDLRTKNAQQNTPNSKYTTQPTTQKSKYATRYAKTLENILQLVFTSREALRIAVHFCVPRAVRRHF